MNRLHGFENPAAYRGGFVSIGNFDGVHRGHRAMIAALTRHARSLQVPSVVFTFDPHPIALLRPDQVPPPITTTARKLDLLEQCGVDCTVVYPTDRALLQLSPREFFDRIILGELAAAGLVEGPNFFFGKARAGTIDVLREFCVQSQLHLEIIAPVTVGPQLVSSTVIRQSIQSGAVAEAADLLGAPYRIRGIVIRGAQRGRIIGFPTANLADIRTVLPRDGVYGGRAFVDGQAFAAGINLGPNPTFQDQQRKVEVHLLDFQGDLYGRTLEIEFLDRLRDTRPFAGIPELTAQLQQDLAAARALADGRAGD